MQIPHE